MQGCFANGHRRSLTLDCQLVQELLIQPILHYYPLGHSANQHPWRSSRRDFITTAISIYLNDLPLAPSSCNLESYVDDSKLFLFFPLSELDAAIKKLEQDLPIVAQWCYENHLLINPDKTKLLFLGTRQMLSRLPQNPSMSFLGATLKPVALAKDLGVILNPHLTYDRHIWKAVSSCFSKLYQIYRVKESFDKETLKLLIKSFVSVVSHLNIW